MKINEDFFFAIFMTCFASMGFLGVAAIWAFAPSNIFIVIAKVIMSITAITLLYPVYSVWKDYLER